MAESKITRICDLNFWYGINHLNNQLTVEKDDIGSCIQYLTSEKIQPLIIISSFFSLFYEPVRGDDQLAEVIRDREGLAGSMFFPNFLFSAKKEFGNYLKKRSKEGFKIMRLAPKSHKYCIDNWAFSYFYSILQDQRMPLIINLEELDVTGNKAIEWKILFEISDKFPELPVIVDGGNSKELMFNNYFFQLLENTKNIFLETHNLLAFNQIEDLAVEFGPGRLVFGSNYPYYPYYMSLNRIREARLTEDDKKNILSGNFRRLMDGSNF
jgi:predicted TIM-barrel fold metal-dependent hydrolase